MLADARMEPLLAKAHDLSPSATQLAGRRVPAELRRWLRSMNSYYTNRMEGQHTRPHEIDQALRKDFSKDARLAARQRLAVAHIEVEVALEQHFAGPDGARALYAADAVQVLHRELFSRLPAEDLSTDGGEAALVACACAHQRLGWVPPFVEGNGRVMRLHTHTMLSCLGYAGGLWSPLRGFARKHRTLLRAPGRCRQPAPGRSGRPWQPERTGTDGLGPLCAGCVPGPGELHGGHARF
jgi:Fic family protein